MALSPLQRLEDRVIQSEPDTQPTLTYSLDFDTGDIGGMIDGETAIRQFIRKVIMTARFRFPIYDGEYGCELIDLIGQDLPMELLRSEIPRVITEALIYDDRIDDVYDFEIEREADKLTVSFYVDTTDGLTLDVVEEV
ncbi:DUF2634 domain-containing protein [Brevibacillus laterosporus]|uniref:DUF2634 domain-containing protein n=1 Tax=Bacillales TaxID=1385 RepID=UPI000F8DBBF2|nr:MULTISPECIES: DUF2634 domain-containing protein [Bacillales]MCR8939853.1 DUF2634 domain-containing protein [Brevibacillus laterosporus]MCZ0842493.1 DUF2634 domain-containing protein [Brevibacillus laterosporus]MCZ0847749.1 DUF2634 domain-containing protein [Brevibacillus laterosporus]RUR57540.1 DUF2634 domain-containing protein [Bacillus sp. VKPM B-3276]